jgi:Xaa-Pro aminopeptidase
VTFRPASLDSITTPAVAATIPLRDLLHKLGLQCARIGYEYGAASEPSSYSGMNLYGSALIDMLRNAASSAPLAPAEQLLSRLACVKTAAEVDRIRMACQVAAQAFEHGHRMVREGAPETMVAAEFRNGFSVVGMAIPDIKRADGYARCMAGPNSAKAKGAFAHSTNRKLQPGDMVLVHANSYADGYWTDITRSYLVGESDAKQRNIYYAISEARSAAFAKICNGARACDVDKTAREVIKRHGFAEQFPHSTGHGVGFAAISANARPRIHPKSNEVLATGMTFNIEPAIYVEGYGGARHCDMVAVTETGMELLTDFQNELP